MTNNFYTTKLGAGQGIIDETRILLELWNPGMDINTLFQVALNSGSFPTITARRLRNIVREGFAPRYLSDGIKPAIYLKTLVNNWSSREFSQLLFLFTCRLHLVLADYIKDVYWQAYVAGKSQLAVEDARKFVESANQDGKTSTKWSDTMVVRVSSYLNGTCSDFGLLESGKKSARDILPFQIYPKVLIYLSYDLHFSGMGDNAMLNHPDWALFGLERADVLSELKKQALKGWFIIQSAGNAARFGWQHESMEAVLDVFTRE
jgi:hypothetical protein